MKKLFLAAGAAALAITVPAIAKPDNDRGGGKGRDRGAQMDRGGGKAQKVQQRRGEQRAKAQERRSKSRERAVEQRSKSREKMAERRARARERAVERRERVAERRDDRRAEQRRERVAERRENRREHMTEMRRDRRGDLRDRRLDAREIRAERIERNRRLALQDRNWGEWDDLARRGVWVDGCPPGLAKKPVACVPPGQAKKMVGQPFSALKERVSFRDLPDRLRYVYRDTDDYYYRYGDGYVYRINRSSDLVSSLLPLFGLGVTAGQVFPSAYSNYYLPAGLQPFYPSDPYSSYRYANGYVYQVDPRTGLIQDVDPLLGYGYGYGQMLPTTYSAYNVPYNYRPIYYDTSDAYYRYAPGAIYQVDPQTSLITGIAALLTNGMTVGQPLPVGYNAYNVPYAYRSNYYDTPNDWYRYANGNIYRVDPTTQLVTALVASILT